MNKFASITNEWINTMKKTINYLQNVKDKSKNELSNNTNDTIQQLSFFSDRLNDFWISFKDEYELSVLNQINLLGKNYVYQNQTLIDERENLLRLKQVKVEELKMVKGDPEKLNDLISKITLRIRELEDKISINLKKYQVSKLKQFPIILQSFISTTCELLFSSTNAFIKCSNGLEEEDYFNSDSQRSSYLSEKLLKPSCGSVGGSPLVVSKSDTITHRCASFRAVEINIEPETPSVVDDIENNNNDEENKLAETLDTVEENNNEVLDNKKNDIPIIPINIKSKIPSPKIHNPIDKPYIKTSKRRSRHLSREVINTLIDKNIFSLKGTSLYGCGRLTYDKEVIPTVSPYFKVYLLNI